MLRLVATLLIAGACALATPVGVPGLSGSRSTAPGGGLSGTEQWASGGFTIAWEITGSGSDWHYKYTMVIPEKGLSHWILQLTPDCVDPGDAACVTGAKFNGSSVVTELNTFSGADPSNTGMPAPIIGVKFDSGSTGTLVYEFDSNRAPVWGSFFAIDGKNKGSDVYAFSNGLDNLDSVDVLDFIARPNGDGGGGGTGEIPEPGTVSLLGLGAALILFGRRFHRG